MKVSIAITVSMYLDATFTLAHATYLMSPGCACQMCTCTVPAHALKHCSGSIILWGWYVVQS